MHLPLLAPSPLTRRYNASASTSTNTSISTTADTSFSGNTVLILAFAASALVLVVIFVVLGCCIRAATAPAVKAPGSSSVVPAGRRRGRKAARSSQLNDQGASGIGLDRLRLAPPVTAPAPAHLHTARAAFHAGTNDFALPFARSSATAPAHRVLTPPLPSPVRREPRSHFSWSTAESFASRHGAGVGVGAGKAGGGRAGGRGVGWAL
ncbi:hypothetical protein B0A49_10336 [Cryomyces minteri]|uniref:Uncharacterized protein n=1 Tax=Cryomyces minteri TaxID=331657 RepID=A0A4U0X8A9_9PEZI|nr:hypothetical protein B0A49_10336 [Cryomyces minteri]